MVCVSRNDPDRYQVDKQIIVLLEVHTSTMVVLAALHIGWLKFLAVFLTEESKTELTLKTRR